jgi:HAD superfamily hydrolase (TIGR01509 family)
MDGTLVDTEPYWMASEHELVAAHGGRWTDDDARSIVGFDLIEAAHVLRERGGVNLDPEEIVDRLSGGVIARVRERVPWRPGARRLLAELGAAGVPCALVTMSWEPLAREIVGALAPASFQAVVTGDMVTNGKPDPEPYLVAAHRVGADPRRCVAIEDSPTGVRSARDAGCVVLAVPNHVPIPTALAPHQAASLKGVTPAHLGELLARAGSGAGDLPAARAPVVSRSGGRPAGGPSLTGPVARRWAALAAVAALLVALIAVVATRDDGDGGDDAARSTTSLVLHTWVPYWALDEAAPELDARSDTIHQLSPFWFQATGVDEIGVDPSTPQETANAFLEAARDHDIPLVASILDATEPRAMAAILADEEQRTAHVDAIVEFAAANDFAGIDLDYERFAFDDGRDTWAATRPNWVAFVGELAERLHDDDRILTVSIPPVYDEGQTTDSGYWVYDYASITPLVDAIRVMAYDYSIAASDPGPIAPLDWVQRVIAGTSAASGDPAKLILGVPLYGRNWPVSAAGECPESAPGVETVTNRAVDDLVRRRDATPTYDAALGEWTFTYEVEWTEGAVSCVQQREVFYVDDDGVQQRIQLALDAGFGGAALFAFGYDDQEVWNNIAAINANLD